MGGSLNLKTPTLFTFQYKNKTKGIRGEKVIPAAILEVKFRKQNWYLKFFFEKQPLFLSLNNTIIDFHEYSIYILIALTKFLDMSSYCLSKQTPIRVEIF